MLASTTGTTVAGVFAGCTGGAVGDSGSESGDPTARASFFVFGNIAARVAGDAATAEPLVPVGQHGHGWEPGPSVREDIRGADLFVHSMDGFQPWVDTIRVDLDADGADVATVTKPDGGEDET